MAWVSRLFLAGFASTAFFGPLVGRLCDSYGRKAGTLAFSIIYSLGAYSTKSDSLPLLLRGRVFGGIGTSLLFSAPEAWLVGEANREGVEGSLGETFGLVSRRLLPFLAVDDPDVVFSSSILARRPTRVTP